MQTDRELVQAVLAGRREAYGELVRRHERALVAAAGSILGNYHAAQDAAQEAFVQAYSRLGSLRKPESFGAWVWQIARRQALKSYRRRERTQPLGESTQIAAPTSNGEVDPRSRRVLAAVMHLPRAQRETVLLRYFGDHSVAVIAEITGRPVGTITSHLSRAAATLRDILENNQ